ncbi:TRAP transporter small permease subunit [Prauserella muralis]|uniref:TRAP transporter small permease subunit n=1 Tax=Prauserella muralis TaxID=588067 RepID=UPI0011ACA9AC|nr:TRAP transporter small permease [Prauserella muralis]TWE27609.1 TRAP-type mannitol/chloroaromatic compound transport system permease small subunit [Prauserella muralis]
MTVLRAANKITKFMLAVGSLACLVMAVQVTADVTGRAILNEPLPGTLETVSSWWMPLIVFLAAGAAQSADDHIRITVLTGVLPPRAKKAADVGALVISGLMIAGVTYFAYESARASIEIGETVAGTMAAPLWPIKFAAAFGLAVYLLQIIATIHRMTRGDSTVDKAGVGSRGHDD